MEKLIISTNGISIGETQGQVYLKAEFTKTCCIFSMRLGFHHLKATIKDKTLFTSALNHYIKQATEKKIKIILLDSSYTRSTFSFGFDVNVVLKELGFSKELSEKNAYILKNYYNLSPKPEYVLNLQTYNPIIKTMTTIFASLKKIEKENPLVQLTLTNFYYNNLFFFYYAGIKLRVHFGKVGDDSLQVWYRNLSVVDSNKDKKFTVAVTMTNSTEFESKFLQVIEDIKMENRLTNLFQVPTKFFDGWCATNRISGKEKDALLSTLLQKYDSVTFEMNFAKRKSHKKATKSIRKSIDDNNNTHLITCLDDIVVIYKVNDEMKVKLFASNEMAEAEQFYTTISMQLFADSLRKQIKKDS